MKSGFLFSMGAVGLVCALAMPTHLVAQEQNPRPARYTVTDLGTLPGGTFSQATYVNNNGLVTGISTAADGSQHAVLWVGGKIVDMAKTGLGGRNSGALGVIPSGKAVGWAESSAMDPNNENFCAYGTGLACLPFVWKGGVMAPLPLLGGNNGAAGPINSQGEAVGLAESSTWDSECPSTPRVNGTGPQVLDFEAVIWGPGPGQIRELPPLPGDTVGMALGINNNGQVVGMSGSCANTIIPPFAVGPHAVLWEADRSVHDLGNLGGTVNPALLGVGNAALAINNRGQVVGASALPGNQTTHAFLWSRQTGMRDLGTLPRDVYSAGLGINDRGDVLGSSIDGPLETGTPHPFIWQNGEMSDLNALVPEDSPSYLLVTFWINDVGQIAGFGLDLNTFEIHAVLATPATGNGGPAARGTTRPVALPENARKLLRR
jgi:probable HAF family extracellular repeat protein